MKTIAIVGGALAGAMAAECLARGAAARTEWDFRCLPREFTRHEGACYSGRWEAAAFFYCGSLAGAVITSRLVQFGASSRTFHEIVEKVVQGAQSYPGLFARVCASLTAWLVEMGLESFRHAFREARYA